MHPGRSMGSRGGESLAALAQHHNSRQSRQPTAIQVERSVVRAVSGMLAHISRVMAAARLPLQRRSRLPASLQHQQSATQQQPWKSNQTSCFVWQLEVLHHMLELPQQRCLAGLLIKRRPAVGT